MNNYVIAALLLVQSVGVIAQNSDPSEKMILQQTTSPSKAFPEGTVWVNCDQQLQIESFSNKILVVVFSDMQSLESGYYMSELAAKYKKFPQIQFIEVLTPNPAFPLSRRNLTQYVQRNNWSHPVAVVPHLNGFGYPISTFPSFAVYHTSTKAELVTAGTAGYLQTVQKLDDYCSQTSEIARIPNNTVIPEVSALSFADPLIENPHRLETDRADNVYVIDQAHSRIIQLDYFGKAKQIFGNGQCDMENGHGESASFNHPQGIAFSDEFLYVADTYNNCVRKIDLTTGLVETLVGTYNYSEKPVKSISNVREPIGLPSDVVIWNDKLYVSSASTNQIFEVNRRTGDCTLFYSANFTGSGKVKECITQLAAGDNALYFVTNAGQAYSVNKKEELTKLPSESGYFFASVCEIGGQLYGTTLQNVIFTLKDGKWALLAGRKQAGFNNGDLPTAMFFWPMDAIEYKGDLLIADSENHAIRTVATNSKGKVRTFPLVLSRELIRERAANSDGELVLMDTVYVGRTASEILVHLNIQNCTIAPGGNNEVHIVPSPGFSLNQEEVKEPSFKFKVDQRIEYDEVNIELYLTIEDPLYPGVYLIKRSYLSFPIGRTPGQSGPQELVYDMHIWPY